SGSPGATPQRRAPPEPAAGASETAGGADPGRVRAASGDNLSVWPRTHLAGAARRGGAPALGPPPPSTEPRPLLPAVPRWPLPPCLPEAERPATLAGRRAGQLPEHSAQELRAARPRLIVRTDARRRLRAGLRLVEGEHALRRLAVPAGRQGTPNG